MDTVVREAVKRLVRSQPPQVTLRATFEDGVIRLDLLKVEPSRRGRGLGTSVMRDLLRLADTFGLPVSLYALSLPGEGHGPDQEALQLWYAGLGFADTGERSVMGLMEMRRAPATGPKDWEKEVRTGARRIIKRQRPGNALDVLARSP